MGYRRFPEVAADHIGHEGEVSLRDRTIQPELLTDLCLRRIGQPVRGERAGALGMEQQERQAESEPDTGKGGSGDPRERAST
jgi:hypothetical protein